jgi:chemotaxis protein methyltransferase CheR
MHQTAQNISHLLKKLHGIDVSMYEDSFIDKSIRQFMQKHGCQRIEEFEQVLSINKKEAIRFEDSLCVSYSEFFRDALAFALLGRVIIPGLLYRNKQKHHNTLRIWSAACAAGQETYSLAIVLEELKNDKNNIGYRIFGTDKHQEQIILAKSGHYDADALGNVTQKQLNKWFTQEGDGYSVIPELKKNIEFSVFDLLDINYCSPPESIYGDFDIVMCANLLFYYKAGHRKLIIEKIKNSLNKNGVVVTGECEKDILLNYGFREVYPHAPILKHP